MKTQKKNTFANNDINSDQEDGFFNSRWLSLSILVIVIINYIR